VKKIFIILFALVLVVSLGLVTAAPVLAGTIIHVPGDYSSIQAAIDAASTGDTIMVAAGTYEAFSVEGKANISIIGAEGATVTTGDWVSINRGPIGDAWVMAGVKDSENINIEGINFDGSAVSGKEVFVGVTYVDSTGSIAHLTAENIIGTELGAGVAIIGDVGTSVVNLAGVTLKNSMAGVIIWDAEANLDACTITGMNPDGGFGKMENGVGILIGVPGDDWYLPSTAEVKASTISNNDAIGIYVCDDSTLEAHFNKIVGNTNFGVWNDGGGTVDATYNWWGANTGPSGFGPGDGDAVSNNVDFVPWLEGVTETVIGGGTVDAKEVADTEVVVSSTANVTIIKLPANPGGEPPSDFGSLRKYIDVWVPDTSQVTQIEIRLYYTNDEVESAYEKYLRLRWWNGTEWARCSDGGVNTADTDGYSGYIWAKIRTDTTPSLADLQGAGFDGGYEGPSTVPGCGCFIATAAYGTDTAKELDILREFRDKVLLPNSLGAKFVSFYYRTSPPIASFISQHDVLRTAVRVGFVDPIVKILNWSHDLWSARGS
jgi:hypothetical protein